MKRAATVAVAFGNPCPSGYENFLLDSATPVCIRFNTEETGSWAAMRALCRAEGADLAELRGDLHLQVYQYIMQHLELADKGFWMGGTDSGSEGTWTWVSDGTVLVLGPPHWYPGQPDGGTKANYACIYPPDYYYHSCNNNLLIYALCQI
ncbi:C-type lectin domain family 4 member E isoform X2 [Procambarus clarkii]|uniref:C-type lectin domain family 4 member E isoform X2 n=1 Tax=Procambarus clarkii TaxID=6728 RepID=UPI001E674933|nr:galactose-specific lectin nattectin-like isoform X2 [Procambarus clarkii]